MLNPEARRGQRHSGQLKNRVEELKNRWRPSSPLVFNYNETARLATDALVEQGEKGYLSVLQDEKELPFLSSLDTEYICTSKPNETRTSEKECDGTDSLLDGHCPSELTSGTYFPYMSDIDAPDLELGWPEIPLATKARKTEVQVFFQKHRTSEIKELVRSHINMAKKVIAVVMDLFTDVDILCDLFEAARKRRVPVYILLDEKNLVYFIEMYEKLGLNKMSLENMKIRTVTGDTYCTKSGKKFSGQCMEKFIMTDCEHVIAGSYSFSWLASHVHSNMVTYFKGSIVEEFDREFRCLYADSLEDKYFNNMENDNNKSFTQGFGNRWPPSKPPTVQPQVLECRSLSNSDSSSDSQSSVKTPPFANHQANTIIHEGKVLSSNPIAKKENEDQVKSKVVSNTDRRQSDPDTDIKNLHIMQTSPLSRSSPILNEKSFLQSTPQGTNRVSGLQRFLHSDNKTSPRMRSEMALNNVPNGAGVEIKMDTILKNGKNEVKGIDPKRMTLGHSKLDLITQYSNMPKKIFSRFGNN